MEVCRGRGGRGIDRQWKFVGDERGGGNQQSFHMGSTVHHLTGDQHLILGSQSTVISEGINTVHHLTGDQHLILGVNWQSSQRDQHCSPSHRGSTLDPGVDWWLSQRQSTLFTISQASTLLILGVSIDSHLRGDQPCSPSHRGSTLLIMGRSINDHLRGDQPCSPSHRGSTLLILGVNKQSSQRESMLFTISQGINTVILGRGHIDDHLRGDQHFTISQRINTWSSEGQLNIISEGINTVHHLTGEQHCWCLGVDWQLFQRGSTLFNISQGINTVDPGGINNCLRWITTLITMSDLRGDRQSPPPPINTVGHLRGDVSESFVTLHVHCVQNHVIYVPPDMPCEARVGR